MKHGVLAQPLFSHDTVKTFKINFYDENWDNLLDSFKKFNSDKRIAARIEFENNVLDSVGIKFKGNSSYNKDYKKNPLNIKFDYVIKGQNLSGYKDLKFSNIFRDPSAIREVLAYKILRKYMPTPNACFVALYINDSYNGLYVCVEDIDKAYVRKHFRYGNGAFFKCENTQFSMPSNCVTPVTDGLTIGFTLDSNCYSNQYEKKSKYGWDKFIQLMMCLWYNNDPSSSYYHQIDKYLDVEQVMFMLAFNNLFVNLDSYSWSGRNYYMVEDKEGKFHPIMWDLNMCFGGFSHFYNPALLSEFPLYAGENNISRPLLSILLKDEEYRKVYIEKYSILIKDIILSGWLDAEAKRLHIMVSPFIEKDPCFYYSFEVFKKALEYTYMNDIPGILELLNKRILFLKTKSELKYIFNK